MQSSDTGPVKKDLLLGTYYLTTEEKSMKRYRFLVAVESALPQLRQMVKGKGMASHEADAIISDVVHGVILRKAFGKMTPESLVPFLKRTALWEIAKRRREDAAYAAKFVQLADPNDVDSYADSVVEEKEMSDDECPYCHVGVLNIHGACGLCHTVVGRRSVPGPKQIHLSDIGSDEDVELTSEVRLALAKLPEEQQRILVRVACGNDTVGDLVTDGGMNMWRKYVAAKDAMRELLKEYAPTA